MKCQILIFGEKKKKKKNISIYYLLKTLPRVLCIKPLSGALRVGVLCTVIVAFRDISIFIVA